MKNTTYEWKSCPDWSMLPRTSFPVLKPGQKIVAVTGQLYGPPKIEFLVETSPLPFKSRIKGARY